MCNNSGPCLAAWERSVAAALHLSVCCVTRFSNTSAYSTEGVHSRSKYRCHQTQTWGTHEFYWSLLQEYGGGVTQRSRNYSDNCITTGHPSMGANQVTKLRTWSTQHSLQAAHQVRVSKWLRSKLLGNSAGVRFWSQSQSSLLNSVSEGLLALIAYSDREGGQ